MAACVKSCDGLMNEWMHGGGDAHCYLCLYGDVPGAPVVTRFLTHVVAKLSMVFVLYDVALLREPSQWLGSMQGRFKVLQADRNVGYL